MRIRALLGIGLVAVLLLAFPHRSSAQAPRQVSIGMASSSLPGGVARIAKEMGLYEKHGLDARVIPMDSGSVAMAGLISGSIDFSTTAGSDVVVAQARGQDIVPVMRLYGGFSAVVVLSKDAAGRLNVSPNAPVTERLKALNGLVIASPAATSSFTLALKPSAEAAGAQIRLTYMAQSAMVAALENGAIQGFIASAPFYAFPVLRKIGVPWINGPKGEFPKTYLPATASGLATKRTFASSNPDVIKRMREVFVDFEKSVKEKPADVKAAIARLFPSLDEATLEFLYESESASFIANLPTAEDMTREIEFVKASGENVPNLDKLNAAAMLLPPG